MRIFMNFTFFSFSITAPLSPALCFYCGFFLFVTDSFS